MSFLNPLSEEDIDFLYGEEVDLDIDYNIVPQLTIAEMKRETEMLVERNGTYVAQPTFGVHITTLAMELCVHSYLTFSRQRQAELVKDFRQGAYIPTIENDNHVRVWLHSVLAPMIFRRMQRNFQRKKVQIQAGHIPLTWYQTIIHETMPDATRFHSLAIKSQGSNTSKQLFTAKYKTCLPFSDANWSHLMYFDQYTNTWTYTEISSVDFTYDFFEARVLVIISFGVWTNKPPNSIPRVRTHFNRA